MGIGCLSLSEIFHVKTAFALRFDITLSFLRKTDADSRKHVTWILLKQLMNSHDRGSIDGHHPKYITKFLTCFAENLFAYTWSSFPSCSWSALQFSKNYMPWWKEQVYPYLCLGKSLTKGENQCGWDLASKGPGPWSTKQNSAPTTCNKATKSAHCNSICPSFPQQHIIGAQRRANKKKIQVPFQNQQPLLGFRSH